MPLPNIYPTMNYDPTEGGLFFLLLEVARTLQKSYNSYEPYVEKRRESLAYRTTSRYLDFG